MESIHTDVAIIGAGPGGSTCGGFLKKYGQNLDVSLFEREAFPRDHVGESQLPLIGNILHELGAWDKVEAAGFPIKIGATYRWGRTDELWDFHFLANGVFRDEPRPGRFEGQRTGTAFQVDRAEYDRILAGHAAELGCRVRYETAVREVRRNGDRVAGLVLHDGAVVEAKYYVDASGHAGILRRAMGVGIEEPSNLRNVAIWDYWQNAEWAVEIGVGGTRVQVLSVGYGWLWFIPLGPTRTSIGLVCPARYYKDRGLKPEDLYRQAIEDEPRVRSLVQGATREGKLATTKDWSFVAERMTGENWFLVGEALGFADPILAAGLTLTHASARECAFSLLEAERGESLSWLRAEYERRNRRRLLQHIRFADYWYTANENFGALKEYTREIAKDAGLELDAEKAFQWLGTGGFVEEDMGIGGLGTVSLVNLHQIARRFSERPSRVALDGANVFLLRLRGAEEIANAWYGQGGVRRSPALRRDGKVLPLTGLFGLIVSGLRQSPRIDHFLRFVRNHLAEAGIPYDDAVEHGLFNCLEAMARDGWIQCRRTDALPPVRYEIGDESPTIAANRDPKPAPSLHDGRGGR